MRREKTSTTTRTCTSPVQARFLVMSLPICKGLKHPHPNPHTSFSFSPGLFLSMFMMSFFLISFNFHRVQIGPNLRSSFCDLAWTHMFLIFFYKLGHGVEQEFHDQWWMVKWLSPMAEPIEANLASSWGRNGRPGSPPPIPRKSLVRLFSTLVELR